ncbi:uncharacterized protein METZ01_LOCUS477343, partial [marine metagenome]
AVNSFGYIYFGGDIRNLTILLLLSLTHILSAQNCADNVTGAFDYFGGCAVVTAPASEGGFELSCSPESEFAGTLVLDECPFSCGICPECGDGSCDYHPLYGETYSNCATDCETPPECDAAVCLNILNVNPDAGTLDIHMKNQEGCLFKEGPNNAEVFEAWTYEECCAVYPQDYLGGGPQGNQSDGICDAWFDGKVAGFQIVIANSSMTVDSVTAGTAVDLDWTLELTPDWERDIDDDGNIDVAG